MNKQELEEALAAAALGENALSLPQIQLILKLWERGVLEDKAAGQRIGWELVRYVDWDKVGSIMALAAKGVENKPHKSPTLKDNEASHIQVPINSNLGVFEKVKQWLTRQ